MNHHRSTMLWFDPSVFLSTSASSSLFLKHFPDASSLWTQNVPPLVLCAQAGFHRESTGRGWDPRYIEAALLKHCPPGSAKQVGISSGAVDWCFNFLIFYVLPSKSQRPSRSCTWEELWKCAMPIWTLAVSTWCIPQTLINSHSCHTPYAPQPHLLSLVSAWPRIQGPCSFEQRLFTFNVGQRIQHLKRRASIWCRFLQVR